MKKIFRLTISFLIFLSGAFVAQAYYEPADNAKAFKGSEICSLDLQMTQNLRAPRTGQRYIRNGKYDGYTRTKVREAHILQKHLNRLGFSAGKVDGVIGPKTRGAILRLQKHLGTKQDGYVGPKTRALLNKSCGSSELISQTVKEKYNFDKDWDKKYQKEDIELSRKAYTDNFAYSDYIASDFNIDAKIRVEDIKTKEYLNADLSLNSDIAVNIPQLEVDLGVDFSYGVDSNHRDFLSEIDKIPKEFQVNYRDFLKGGLKLNAVVKDLDIYIKVSDIPGYYWKSLEGEMDQVNKISDKKVKIDDFKRYEGEWIKIEIDNNIKEFSKLMMNSVLEELKKQSLSQAKIYRERPFVIIDESSRERSGKYYSYDAKIDLENLVYIAEKIAVENNQNGVSISNSDVSDMKNMLSENKDILKDVQLKVYLDRNSDEMRKFSLTANLNLNEIEKNVKAEISFNLDSETKHISNTRKNDISAPKNSTKWENIFENIFGIDYEKYQEEQYKAMVEKANDAYVKSYMAGLRTQAAIYYFDKDSSYKNICNVFGKKITNIINFNCRDSDVGYVVEAKLSDGKYLCMDSMGNNKENDTKISTGYSCQKEDN